MNTKRSKAARPAKPRPSKAAPSETPDAMQHEIPGPESVADHQSWAELLDADQVTAAAKAISPDLVIPVSQQFAACRKALRKAGRTEACSFRDRCTALTSIYRAGREAYAHPEIMIGAALAAKIACNKRSLGAGFLLAVKLADPKIDRKTASFYARALNYAAACGWTDAELFAALEAHGVKALADNEAKRQRLRKSGTADEPVEDPLEQFLRERQPAVPLAQVTFPEELEEQGVALLVVRLHKGKVEALDFDNDLKRLLAVVRSAIKRGQISPRGGAQRPQAAE